MIHPIDPRRMVPPTTVASIAALIVAIAGETYDERIGPAISISPNADAPQNARAGTNQSAASPNNTRATGRMDIVLSKSCDCRSARGNTRETLCEVSTSFNRHSAVDPDMLVG